ncbi:MAG TPA: PAS domain S-box protein [Bacteroidia bacterium]|jgi:PAS domain S-box-containing protein
MKNITIGVYSENKEQFLHISNIINQGLPSSQVIPVVFPPDDKDQRFDVLFLAPSSENVFDVSIRARNEFTSAPLILLADRMSSAINNLNVDDILLVSQLSPYVVLKSFEYASSRRTLHNHIRSISSSREPGNIGTPLAGVEQQPFEEAESDGSPLVHDNRELKAFITKLKNSYHRIQTVMDYSSDCFIELDTNLKVINFNRNAQEFYKLLFDRTFEIGDFILDHASGERRRELELLYEEVLSGKRRLDKFEVNKDGLLRTFRKKYLPVTDLNGKVTSVTFIAEEITNEENSLRALIGRQQELQAAEKNYRDLFEKSNEGIIIHDELSGRIIDINQNACDIIQASKEEVLNGSLDVFGHHITGYRFSDAIRDQKRTVVNGKQSFDWQAGRRDGSFCWLEVSLFPTEIGGNKRILVFIKDINERKAGEELAKTTLRANEKILNASLDVICSIDSDGKFVMVSNASSKVWGYAPQEIIGRRYMDMVYKEDHEKTSRIAQEITNGNSVRNFENRYVKKNGELVDIIWSATWDPEDNLMYCTAKDASEKKELERALEYEQVRYREIFNKAPASIAMAKGADHRFIMANPLYLDLTGRNDIVGKTVKETLPEVEGQGFIKLLDDVYKTGVPFAAREALVTINTDGAAKEVYLDFIYQAYEDSQKNIEGVIYFGIDVTEKVLARRMIKESEERYKQIIETAQEGIWMWDEKGIITFCNQKLCDLLGFTQSEIIGKRHTSFMDRSEHDFASRYFSEVNKGVKNRCELKYRSRDGSVIWVHVAGSALFESGEFKGTMAMVSDVTTRKLAEEKLRKSEANLNSIMDNTNVAYTLLDKDLRIILFNQAAYDGTYKEQGKKLEVGRHIREFAPEERVNEIDAVYARVLNGNILNSTVSFTNNNQTHFYSVKLYPVCSTDNHTLGVLIAMDDITERKHAEELLEKQNKELRKTNEELDRFVYSASHDLRAPLASILGLLNISNLEDDIVQLRNINKMILTSVIKLDSFIKDIVDYSRNSRLEIISEPISFKNLVNDSIEQLHYMEAARNIDIRILVNDSVEFRSDKKRIGVIVNNLLSNAIKYHNLRQEHPYIYFRVNFLEDKAVIEVEDNGSGIHPDSIDKIFNMFYRGSENSPGSGLGLYIVKEIVEKLSGSISVKSTLGNGTMFNIEIPNRR